MSMTSKVSNATITMYPHVQTASAATTRSNADSSSANRWVYKSVFNFSNRHLFGDVPPDASSLNAYRPYTAPALPKVSTLPIKKHEDNVIAIFESIIQERRPAHNEADVKRMNAESDTEFLEGMVKELRQKQQERITTLFADARARSAPLMSENSARLEVIALRRYLRYCKKYDAKMFEIYMKLNGLDKNGEPFLKPCRELAVKPPFKSRSVNDEARILREIHAYKPPSAITASV